MRHRHLPLIRYAVIALLAVPLVAVAGGSMKMTAVSFPMPTDDRPIHLQGLSYGGAGGTVEITSARLEILSGEGEDPIRATWTLGGSNTKPQTRRVQLRLYLIEGEKKRIASEQETVILKGNDEEQEFTLEMTVDAATWARADRVYLRADFLSR